MIFRALLLGLALAAPPALALELTLPASARQLVERNSKADRYRAPVAVFDGTTLPSLTIEGQIARAAWRLDAPGLTTLRVMRPLRDQLEDAGFDIVLDCVADACGGFDFRFATEVLPGPHMYVNIAAFQFMTALRGKADAPDEVVTVLASTTTGSAYVQIIQAGGTRTTVTATGPAPTATLPVPQGDLSAALLDRGHAVLEDLEFATGSSDLGPGPFASLQGLAALLTVRPKLRIALVGHTDSVGSLDANIALSRRRARSVRQRLIEAHGIAATRMEAEGMGYLAPVASNLAEDGREANRRVEAILLSE